MRRAGNPETLGPGFQALSDPTRLAILAQLADGERCVCDIQSDLQLSQPLLSFHLRVLRQAGLVRSRKAGRWSYYEIDPAGLEPLKQHLGQLQLATRRSLPVRQEAY